MITLGIETSCDETSVAVVQKSRILSNVVSSSVPLHEKFGGVIPEIASRFHVEYINKVTKKALRNAKLAVSDVDLISVTGKPGLPGSLISGLSFGRALGYALGKPVIEIDHLLAHLYANFLDKPKGSITFPFVGTVVSGGHTSIFICRSFKDYDIVGRTKDDAIGEAFDKVAKILKIGYPGGPKIEKYARKGRLRGDIAFPRVYLEKDSLDFSLSGIKTAVFYRIRGRKPGQREIAEISRAFQESVFDVLVEKVIRACKKFGISEILMGGGVISNMRLREKFTGVCKRLGYNLFYPLPALCVDNAAMVAGLGEKLFERR